MLKNKDLANKSSLWSISLYPPLTGMVVDVHLWLYKCTLYTLQSIAFTTRFCKD